MKQIVLASTSIYRKQLLEKTGWSFICEKPSFNEELAKNILLKSHHSPLEIAEALSRGKAESIAATDRLIIAGDQLVNLEGHILGKAGDFNAAFRQLKMMNGRSHQLITAVTIKTAEQTLHLNHLTELQMKDLTDSEISNYLEIDTPYDSSGSYKIESSGMLLFEKIETDDYSAIQGLPLHWLTQQLKGMGYELFKK